MAEDQVYRGNFDSLAAEAEQQTILLRHAIETPGVICRAIRQITHLTHPLAAPRSRIKKWLNPKRAFRRLDQSAPEQIAGDHLRLLRFCGLEEKIDFCKQLLF